MTFGQAMSPNVRWRRIDVVSDNRSHTGWWREVGEQVNLESIYGRCSRLVGDDAPDRLAIDMLFELIRRQPDEGTGG